MVLAEVRLQFQGRMIWESRMTRMFKQGSGFGLGFSETEGFKGFGALTWDCRRCHFDQTLGAFRNI